MRVMTIKPCPRVLYKTQSKPWQTVIIYIHVPQNYPGCKEQLSRQQNVHRFKEPYKCNRTPGINSEGPGGMENKSRRKHGRNVPGHHGNHHLP